VRKDLQIQPGWSTPLHSRLATLLLVAVYAVALVVTNTRFTILDDEATFIATSGRPGLHALRLFLTGAGTHELHPPLSDLLLHLWLVATYYSFFALRIFANILFIAAIYVISKCAERLAGKPAYWTTLILAFLWPFAFQYGRITGWYGWSMLLVSLVTLAYLQLLEVPGFWPWTAFALASELLLWSNYFGFVVLFLLLFDFIVFHNDLLRRHLRPLLATTAFIAAGFLPLLWVAAHDVAVNSAPVAAQFSWKGQIATLGYPAFAIFASAAVAPWFWPLSLPVFLAVVLLFVSIWRSPARRWLAYFLVSMLLLDVAGQMNIKRVLFLTPWLFMAMGVAAGHPASRHRRLQWFALAVLVACGWIGIASGNHYATTNLYEPWEKVARVVARDARSGATIVSENSPFFFYLDYQLGMQSDTQNAKGAYLGADLYRAHGYKILQPDDWQSWVQTLHGKVVLVNGPMIKDEVEAENALDDFLRPRCTILGQYRAAPDPAAAWKARFVRDSAVLAYRTRVVWYDCGRSTR
jgi:hypothetical protein